MGDGRPPTSTSGSEGVPSALPPTAAAAAHPLLELTLFVLPKPSQAVGHRMCWRKVRGDRPRLKGNSSKRTVEELKEELLKRRTEGGWGGVGVGAAEGSCTVPAEVQQGPGRVGDPAVHPGQEVKLGDGARLVGLQVLQVEAPNQEVLAPDVLRHQVDLRGRGGRGGFRQRKQEAPGCGSPSGRQTS